MRNVSLSTTPFTATGLTPSLALCVALSTLVGCGGESESTSSAPGIASSSSGIDSTPAPEVWDERGFAEARAIYQSACASCHDPGASDAPAIGVREDWDQRSRNWVAVLEEHAKHGYLDMPAKGGATDLSDKQVGAAAEYILAVTYPELPLD